MIVLGARATSRGEAARVFGLHRETVSKMLRYSVPPGYRRGDPVRRPKEVISGSLVIHYEALSITISNHTRISVSTNTPGVLNWTLEAPKPHPRFRLLLPKR